MYNINEKDIKICIFLALFSPFILPLVVILYDPLVTVCDENICEGDKIIYEKRCGTIEVFVGYVGSNRWSIEMDNGQKLILNESQFSISDECK
jgi:hypothetical protein